MESGDETRKGSGDGFYFYGYKREYQEEPHTKRTIRFDNDVEVFEYRPMVPDDNGRKFSIPLRGEDVCTHKDQLDGSHSDGPCDFCGERREFISEQVLEEDVGWDGKSSPVDYSPGFASPVDSNSSSGDERGAASPMLDIDVPRRTHSRSHLDPVALRRLEYSVPFGGQSLAIPGHPSNPFGPQSSGYLPPNRNVALVSLQLRSTHPITHVHTIAGRVLVRNIAFEKQVFARWTIDDWKTTHDENAAFAQHFGDTRDLNGPGTDAFDFTIQVDSRGHGSSESLIQHMNRMAKGWARNRAGPGNNSLVIAMQLAICYRVDGKEFWDNSNGQNYALSLTTI